MDEGIGWTHATRGRRRRNAECPGKDGKGCIVCVKGRERQGGGNDMCAWVGVCLCVVVVRCKI